MISARLHSIRTLVRMNMRFFSQLQQQTTTTTTPTQSYKIQFTKSKLTDFGELPQGEIPEALKYDRPIQQSALENGVRVVSETWQSPLASVTVLVGVGSRAETLENSSVSQFLQRLNLRGTNSKTREQVESELDSLGGQLTVNTGREQQVYTLTFEPSNTERAVSFLGEILTNSLYSSAQVEAEKDGIYRNSVDQTDQLRVVSETGHYTSFRDHYMGQPVTGIRENIVNITADHVQQFHKNHFVGPNVIVTGAGPINHEQFVQVVGKAFGGLSPNTPVSVPNSEQPYFTPSIINMRDDELTNLNVGVFFEVPKANHPDSIALHFFSRILGEYRADKYTGAHLNSADKQYNQMHVMFGNLPDVTIHKPIYTPYSDTGLFGNYIMGNEVYAMQMSFISQMVLSQYASYINPVEVFRARARVFNELLSEESTSKTSFHIAKQVQYWGRRLPRSEFATRVSALDAGILNRVATRHFWDKDISVVLWGPTHILQSISHYNRPWKRSTLGIQAYHYYEQQ